MKIGLIPPYAAGPVEERAFALGFARLAEELGFESVWVVEHVVLPEAYRSTYPYDPSGRMPYGAATPQPDPLVWLAAASAATERLRLATGILELPLRNPVVLAKELATLDRLAEGRLILGVGLGWMREEAEAVGVPFEGRALRAEESLRAMQCLWRDEVASFEGRTVRFHRVRCEPRPFRPGGIPVVVGGHTEAAARRAGRLGNGLYPLVPPERIPELRRVM
ncbi:MAG: TIGR03619 family F420-dependent LLM class oxidoreductase, partial [Nitrospirae bacterium]